MGIFDRFRRKEQPPKRRSYAGVNTSRLFADFSTMTRSSDAELKPALRVLRNRCRELARNDEYVRRYLALLKTNVIGPHGVNVQAKARNADGSLDAPGNKIVENAWKAWGQRGNCTVDGRLSWVDAQRLFIETLARDGEVLVRFVNGYSNLERFAIEFVEADILDEELNTKADNGNRIRMGVEVDDFGKVSKSIIIRQISSITIMRPFLFPNFITFTYPGSPASTGNLMRDALAENALMMNFFDNRPFFELKARMDKLRYEH